MPTNTINVQGEVSDGELALHRLLVLMVADVVHSKSGNGRLSAASV